MVQYNSCARATSRSNVRQSNHLTDKAAHLFVHVLTFFAEQVR